MTTPALELVGVVKDYKGLRPLRVQHLVVQPGDIVTLGGVDPVASAVLTDLITGTTLPESGDVRVEGRSTTAITTEAEWLSFLDGFGMVNERVVLLDQLNVAQNLAVPLTLDLDTLAPTTRRHVERIATAVGLAAGELERPLSRAPALTMLRVRLGRSVAHSPRILLVEHPTVGLGDGDIPAAATDLRRACRGQRLTALVTTNDPRLARRLATRSLVLRPATGEVAEEGVRRRWFR